MNRLKKAVFLQKRYTADSFFDCMTAQKHKQKRTLHLCKVLLGAANQIRTGDLVLTKDGKKSVFSRVFCLFSAFDNFFDYPR